MDVIEYEPKAYYIFDRAYIDFKRLNKIEKVGAYFVTRAKKNISYNVVEYVNEINLETGILKHEVIKLKGRPQNK